MVTPIKQSTDTKETVYQIEEALANALKSELHLRSILESSADCIKVMDWEGRILSMNHPGMCLMEIDDFCTIEGQIWTDFWRGDDHEQALTALARARTEGRGHFQGYCNTAKGVRKWWDVLVTAVPVAEGEPALLLGVSRDLTELRETTQSLEEKQKEIETLNLELRRAMQETHHRVKNNLQVVSAMIEMQLVDYEDAQAVPLEKLLQLKTHVNTLSIVHDLLTENVKAKEGGDLVSAQAVLEYFLLMLKQTIKQGKSLSYVIEDTALTSQQCLAVSLLLNELVSNALKHGDKKADVTFCVQGADAVLTVSDDGKGFPVGFDALQSANTGLELVVSLVRGDLKGRLDFATQPHGGGKVTVTFLLPQVNE